MRALTEIAGFLWRVRNGLKFGEYSRARLKLLRFELRENTAECEWLARPNDPWDVDLPAHVREQNYSLQALRDALQMREALFKSIPDVDSVRIRVYELRGSTDPELIITGHLSRDDEPPPRLSSPVMQARLAGLRFHLADGVFEGLGGRTGSLQFANQ